MYTNRKILFVTSNGVKDCAFGGPKGSIRNYKALKKYGKVDLFKLNRKSTFHSILSICQGYYPPINKKDYEVLGEISKKNYDLVFFDGSIYGDWIDLFANSRKVVFYHNCEHDYIGVRFNHKQNLKRRIYQRIIDKNESYITRKADYLITFSHRDSKRLEKLYGRCADLIVPLGIEDKYTYQHKGSEENTCLLLGSAGPANIEGYGWFVKNVSPFLKCKTIIAGDGFEAFKKQWQNDKVIVKGFVENLEQEYDRATCVVIPLFSGGGMKVKTVEALMFGKTIFGTKEAFSGFNFEEFGVAYQCNSVQDFIRDINRFLDQKPNSYNDKSRKLYEEKYSIDSATKLFGYMMMQLFMEEHE